MDARRWAGAGARATGRFRADLLATARRDRALYALALTVLLTGFAMQPLTGNRPDWAIVTGLGGPILMVGAGLALAALAGRLAWLAIVARSATPAWDLAGRAARFLGRPGLAANALHTLALFLIFAAGFAVLKGAIAVVAPFAWDQALAEVDRALHFGQPPHVWLQPLLAQPWIVCAVNFAYNLWFFVVVASFIAAGITGNQRLRHQYLMSLMLVWFAGGFLVAAAFSSAGPAYYQRIGLGDLYAPLMQQLHAVAARVPVWALDTQDMLWDGFTGARRGSAGISAFPSMHVATATLFVLAARRIRPWLLPVALVYWGAILLGSVLLAWHYAVDGYAATLMALLAWRLCGRYARRFPEPGPVPLPA